MALSAVEEALGLASELAQQAGEVLLQWRGRLERAAVRHKSSARDLVTEADLASERLILDGLRRAFAGDGFLAEETGGHEVDRPHVWYIDPLDGTVNFVHQLPLFSISIARVTRGRPDLAVVHAPALGETFTAWTGGGAWCHGRRLQVSAASALDEAVLATGFPYRRQHLLENNLENFDRMFLRVRGLRRLGSAALDLAFCAAGRLDGFWELHLQPFDVAAGALLVQEAGGVVDTIVPGGDWLHGRNILGGPAALVAAMRAVLLEGRGPGYPPLGERGGGAIPSRS